MAIPKGRKNNLVSLVIEQRKVGTHMNNTFAQALALALTLTDDEKVLLVQTLAQLGVAHANASVSTPAQAVAPAPKEQKTYEPATDVVIPLTLVKGAGRGKKAFKLGYGNGRAGAKLCIKDAGFAWNAELGAYVGTNAQFESLSTRKDGKDVVLEVSANWVEQGRAKAQAKAARKAAKGC